MANVFTKENNATPKPNRNSFPMGYTNNLSLKMGQITPFYVQEVMSGDSWRANDVLFGFNSFPMLYPVQSDITANVHFFYVRNRALWRGWQDFITKQDNIDGDNVKPYIMLNNENRDMINTGSIGDFLGVPTVFYSSDNVDINYTFENFADSVNHEYYYYCRVPRNFYSIEPSGTDATAVIEMYKPIVQGIIDRFDDNGVPKTNKTGKFSFRSNLSVTPCYYGKLPQGAQSVTFYPYNMIAQLYDPSMSSSTSGRTQCFCVIYKDRQIVDFYTFCVQNGNTLYSFGSSDKFVFTPPSSSLSGTLEYIDTESPLTDLQYVFFLNNSFGSGDVDLTYPLPVSAKDNVIINAHYPIPNKYRDLSDLPFCSTSNSDGIRIDAMPYRAVEAVYNSFYRDERNNPLLIDGKPYYNIWIENNHGGADTGHYHLYQRNWEQDVYTTAVQSPQQGVAPLVGVTASGQMTFQDDEGKTYYLQAQFDEDGHTITGIKSYSSDMPVGTLRAMVDTISTGISINDFRNVNALQRWLETNVRKGYRYKDQIEAHFGVSPTYSELQMPEFIGGMSRKVNVNKVTQTSEGTPSSPLGSLGGNANILGKSDHNITHFCDEHGWIIGFITLSPKPVYSQTFNKMFHRTELFDYYFPEFAHIGFQPILNQEVSPLQCDNTEGNKLTDVFGYQRAWYEYLNRTDEVHGDFRETLRDFLVQRTFDGVPKLSNDFLTINPDEANEVFVDQNNNDKFFGQIVVDVVMKRPLPTVAIPRLE